MGKDTRLVWSDDPRDRQNVEGKSATKKTAEPPVLNNDWTAVFRIEKGGRGGKTVTVIDQLPKFDTFLKALCKELKAKCGSGGTHVITGDHGVIEIQGDKRDVIKAIFAKKGYRYKGM